MNADDIDEWCDEHCPELYNEGMFDDEGTADEVWDLVTDTLRETVLDFVDDEDERDELHDAVLESVRDWFRSHHETVLETLAPVNDVTIQTLVNKPQVAQHSADWYNQRRNRLTASEFANILDGRRGALLRSKISNDTGDRVIATAPVAIAQYDGELPATYWGHRFEPVTRDIYELELAGVGTVNDTLGRFTHPTVPWLSASPDGLVVRGPLAGRLVEIKSPKSRQPGEFVPSDYYAQMQIQMEVCNLDAVDFVEAQFTQVPLEINTTSHTYLDSEEDVSSQSNRRDLTDEETAACTAARWKGRVEVYGRMEDSSTWTYRYTAPTEELEEAVFTTPVPADLPLLEHSVWWLTGWYPRTVLRNAVWWNSIGWPNAELFWAEVQSLRTNTNDIIQHIEDDADSVIWRT